jgi:hypothetical protein
MLRPKPLLALILALSIFAVLKAPPLRAEAAASDLPTLNRMAFPDLPADKSYSYIVIGHGYGRSVSLHNMPHQLPAASLLANIDKLKDLNADFVVMLGDVYWRMETPWVTAFQKQIMDRIGIPFINAVGNHDITRYSAAGKVVLDANVYKERFGDTYFSFRAGSDFHIVVDTVTGGRSIQGAQKKFLEAKIAAAAANPDVRNVMFWSHHLVWTQIDPNYAELKGMPGNWNFKSEIYPLIQDLAKTKNVYWGSGNFGEPPNISLFYDRRQQENLTVFATGLGDTRHDLVLHVTVSNDAKVSIKPISLTGDALPAIEKFDVAANKKIADQWYALNWNFLVERPRPNPPNLREKFELVFSVRYFWHGIFAASSFWIGVLLTGAVLIFVRRRRYR